MKKQSNTEAAWALLGSMVSDARVDAHRLRHLVNRGLSLIEKDSPEQKEHLYQVAGDLIQAVPERLSQLEATLDKCNYALAKMEQDFLKSRLSISDKKEIEEVMETTLMPVQNPKQASTLKVAQLWLQKQADLMPPLGRPGGPCHVVKRIEDRVHTPALKEDLIDEVEVGADLSNQEASKVYGVDVELGAGMWRKMVLVGHAQYRMDLRGIGVGVLQKSLGDLSTEMTRDRRLMVEVMSSGRPYRWNDPKRKLTIVLESEGREAVRIITVFPTGTPDPKPPGEGGCQYA